MIRLRALTVADLGHCLIDFILSSSEAPSEIQVTDLIRGREGERGGRREREREGGREGGKKRETEGKEEGQRKGCKFSSLFQCTVTICPTLKSSFIV